MKSIYFLIGVFAMVIFSFSACTKDVPEEMLNTGKTDSDPHQEMPDDDIHRNIRQGFEHAIDDKENTEDQKKAEMLMKEADDADQKFTKSKSENDRKDAVELHLLAANFVMLEANLPPKQKYRPAYKRYIRVLELDPKNEEAIYNKQLIEDIYSQMGMEVPKDN